VHTWKIALVGTILGAAVIGAAIHYSSNPFGRAGGNALAAHGMDSRQPVSTVTNPITPSKVIPDSRTSGSEHGWGPFRTVDW
jgi:hypothetical protein